MANEGSTVSQEQILQMQAALRQIRENIAAACAEAGRAPEEVSLMAVTKTVQPELINAAIDEGVTLLGENRVQEYLSKRELYRPEAEVQFIGHLQTNKVKQIIDKVTMIHSVGSLHLAEAIEKAAAAKDIVMPVLLEVNIGSELTKSGTSPDELPQLAEEVIKLPHLRVQGLMTIPPPTADPEEQDAVFADMQRLWQQMQQIAPMPVLSMGMSGDYEAAIKRGATIVRIGSALFGARYYPPKQA